MRKAEIYLGGIKEIVFVHKIDYDSNGDPAAIIERNSGEIKSVHVSEIKMLNSPDNEEYNFIQELREILTNGSMTIRTFN